MLEAENEEDRRRLLVVSGAIATMAFAISVSVVSCENKDNNSKPALLPETDSANTPNDNINQSAQNFGCQYNEMDSDPSQIVILQDYLARNGYYDGEEDGIYDADVKSAVRQFQADSKEDGRYLAVIDGLAGYFTCLAMGEPYFIQQNS